MDFRFKHPFTCLVAGPTKAGKTTFVKSLIKHRNECISENISKIWWCYGEYQDSYDALKGDVFFIKGFPDMNLIRETCPEPQLLILDDLMQEMQNDSSLVELFTRGCHHLNVSIIHIVQNVFFKGLRTSRVNAQYIVLMKNPSDKLQCQTLARQLFPTNVKYFLDSYADATADAFSYLLLDLTQTTADRFRLRADIFAKYPTIYVPKV